MFYIRASPAKEVNRVAKPARIATQLGPLATRAALPNTQGCYYNYQRSVNLHYPSSPGIASTSPQYSSIKRHITPPHTPQTTMNTQFLENLLESQAIALATTRQVQTVLSDTVNVILNQDNEESNQETLVRGGSRPGRRANLNHGFEEGYQRFYKDYLAPEPVYVDDLFRRQFRMHRGLFLKIVDDLTEHNHYFKRKADALGRLGLYPVQKVASAIWMLAYGGAADINDEYF
ncbi:uncharacterized protein PGTG_21015 [Puccinia graminis f. sp. tritici CRL 75-36-700-3]|uniref:Uncharacterized protein n=1 Tax=Puccinia graminis f. sp. tritici (strain CRL 75-36-700-3 / race SCCL) TaxID=418459 RepID=H6QQ36_PUCGT|nr:uncharacterized protein PGTG_21015 [Puccinia graminis f. sp. tritici CRL 75-36-700-3]EHS64664.1 hypothetical protein PGTG_21015 [Puccinia graminis f. sp. tritici CRL 75-36-700-3]